MFLTALVSLGSPGNTSSPLVPALSALKLSWESKAWKMETLDTAEKLAEVLALCMGAPDTQGEGILCVISLLANYLEITCDLKFKKIWNR